MPEAVPVHMAHLAGEPAGIPVGEELADRDQETGEAHDKQHVEAPQGIDGEQSFLVHTLWVSSPTKILYSKRKSKVFPRRKKETGPKEPVSF